VCSNGPDNVYGIGSLQENNGHLLNGVLKSTKGWCFEGGTRLPFISRAGREMSDLRCPKN